MSSRLARTLRGGAAALVLLLGLVGSAAAQLPPTPEVIEPSADAAWDVDSTRNIRWASLPGENVQVELSRDAGATFETLFNNIPNDGTQFWTVTGPASLECLIRVRSLEEPTVAATSATFRITDPLHVLTVTSPIGGEIWQAGSQQLLTWTAPGEGNVRVELSVDGGVTFETVFGTTPNDGAQPWMVPETLTTQARIRITHINDPSLTDVSDENFEIAPVPGIQITTPSGGEQWEIGTRREIRWEGTLEGGALVELSRDGGATWETLFTNTPNDGAADWEVVGPASATCRVRVTALDPVNELTLVGESAADFAIVADVTSFALTRPKGQEIFVIGTQQLITWNAPTGGNVRIELSRDAGVSWETIFGNTPNDGLQIWTVAGPVSPACLMRLTSLDDETVFDVSDETFYITGTPGLVVGAPNGGEVWTLGSVQTIFWSGLEGGRVKIELSRDGGAVDGEWETLFASTPNDGAVQWVVTGVPTTNALIRVSRLSPPEVSDVSDEVFEIDQAPLAVVAPKELDEWVIGSQRLVQWSSLPVGEVQIDVSRDGGGVFVPMFPTTPNDGGQFWLVEGPPTEEAVVRVTALGDTPGFALSEGLFRIIRGTLDLAVPNGGEQWAIGTPRVITWNTTTQGSVHIELSRNGGGTWETLFLNTPNDGNELWTATGPPCTDCLLRIASWQDETLLDMSAAPFSLVCAVSTAAILPGQEITDVLAASDCEAPHRPGGKGKLYTFILEEAGLVSIDVRSAAFQGHLYLTAPDGHLIGDAPGIIDSVDLPAGGPYTIELTSANPGAAGTFTLRLQLFDVTLLSPVGGVPWKLGEYQFITWRSPAPGVPADIRIIRNGGSPENVVLATPNDGGELWRVAAPIADHAVIRICIPYGSRGTQICDQSSPFVISRCNQNETRACYTGPPGTSGVGDCVRGNQTCGDDGVLGTCQGEVLPAVDICGDGRDQDCRGGDQVCRPCSPDASCSDGDACTADACVDGLCMNTVPAPMPLFACRATALDQALASILTGCEGARPALRARQARRLAKMLAKIEHLATKATNAGQRRRCVQRVTSARRTSMKLKALLERNVARGVICEGIAALVQTRLSGVGEAIIAVSACEGKS
jgi:hypothetical protein